MTSHSPVVINGFLELGEAGSIYEFSRRPELNEYVIPNYQLEDRAGKAFPTVSTARHVAAEFYSILDGLGANGADLLQCNGVVWVEGPSDVIYIRKWLEMYADEKGKRRISQGIDYEFQMFGGTLLSHLQIDGENDEDAADHMVKMFSFSRNAYVVIDGDLGKSKFEPAKKRIETEWLKHSKDRPDELGLWYDKKGKIKTIEDYITHPQSRSQIAGSGSKVKKATACVLLWDALSLADFTADLPQRIEDLYYKITAWNDR